MVETTEAKHVCREFAAVPHRNGRTHTTGFISFFLAVSLIAL